MSTEQVALDSFLSRVEVGSDAALGDFLEQTIPSNGTIQNWHEEGYTGSIDYRVRQISYSSLLTLHSCPRKFELYRKRSTFRAEDSLKTQVTFAFGHIVGEGIQLVLQEKEESDILFRLFCMWAPELFAEDEKLNKSFWHGWYAVRKFKQVKDMILRDYELCYYQGKPACELSFVIKLPDGFSYRGSVDAVLKHKVTGKVMVLEVKTTGSKAINPATYKNSAQAIGYSIVLDHLFDGLSEYEVLYLPYQTHSQEFTPIPFVKTFLQRALWLRELLLDIDTIKLYEQAEVYPMRGESCMSFMKECEYLSHCTLSTDYLTKPCTQEMEDKKEYDVVVTFEELLEAQFNKAQS